MINLREFVLWRCKSLLGGFALLQRWFYKIDTTSTVPFKKLKKILFILDGGMGDSLLATPAIQLLRRHATNAKFIAFCPPSTAELLSCTNLIDSIIVKKGKMSLRQKIDLIRQLRREHINGMLIYAALH